MESEDITSVIKINKNFEQTFGKHKRKCPEYEENEWMRMRPALKEVSELLRTKDRLIKLESRLSSAQAGLKEQAIKHQQQLDNITNAHNVERRKDEDERVEVARLVEKCEDMVEENGMLKERGKELEGSLKQAKIQHSKHHLASVLQLDTEKGAWEEERRALKEELVALRRSERQAREGREEVDARVEVLQRRVKEMGGWEAEVEGLQHELSVARHQLQEAALERSRESSGGKGKREMDVELKKLAKQVDYLSTLRENDFLLVERANSAEGKIQRLTEKNANMEIVEEQNKKLKKRLQDFEKMMQQLPQAKTANEVCVIVTQLSTQALVQADQKAHVTRKLRSLEDEVKCLEDEVERVGSELKTCRLDHNNSLQSSRLSQTKLVIATMERDNYLGMVDVSFNDQPSDKVKLMMQKLQIVEQSKKHMEAELVTCCSARAKLQSQVQELHQSLMKERNTKSSLHHHPQSSSSIISPTQSVSSFILSPLQASSSQQSSSSQPSQPPQSSSPSTPSTMQPPTRLDNQILRERVSELEGCLKVLQDEKEVLVYEAEKGGRMGHYNRTSTKVISLTDNPFSQRRRALVSECQSWKQENQLLKTKLKLAREGSEDLTIRSSKMIASIGTVKEQEELKRQLSSGELLTKRLKDNYEKISQSFKRLVCTLLGFKVEKLSDKRFSVTSFFSQQPDHYFIFEECKDGDFKLVCNDYLKVYFADLVDKYITSSSSYPSFMAAVTLRLDSQ